MLFNNNKICFLIPARGGSKGIINKNLKKINGLTLVDIAINFAQKLVNSKDIFLSSDSEKILKCGLKKKIRLIKRPKYLSHGRVSDIDLILKSLQVILKKNANYKYLIYLQPTSPIRNVSHLKEAINIIHSKKYDSVWSVSKIDKKFHPLKLLNRKKNGKINLYSNAGEKIIARQQLGDCFIRNGVFYIFKISKLLKNQSIYFKNSYGFEIKSKIVNIDNLNDLKVARKMLKNKFL